MTQSKAKIDFRGSWFWLIFWFIFFFPIALVLLFTDSVFHGGQKSYRFIYNGSRFWLCFWLIFFFPISFLLMCFKGFTIDVQQL